MGRFASWVMDELGPDVPVHLFRFQPAYRLSEHWRAWSLDQLYRIRPVDRAGIALRLPGRGHRRGPGHPLPGLWCDGRLSSGGGGYGKDLCQERGGEPFCPTFSQVEGIESITDAVLNVVNPYLFKKTNVWTIINDCIERIVDGHPSIKGFITIDRHAMSKFFHYLGGSA